MSQQTARTRSNHFARRAAAVSAGAFALCLAGATPALADLDPVPLPDLSPVTDAASPVTDVVEPVVPVEETVADLEQKLGTTDTTTSTPKPHTKPVTSVVDTTTTTTPTRDARTGHKQRKPFSDPGPAAVSPTYIPTWSGPASALPGLRSSVADAAAPAVAAPATPEHSVISLAGGTLKDLGDAGTPAGRTLLVIISTLTIGALAGAHVKAAQDRLTAGIA